MDHKKKLLQDLTALYQNALNHDNLTTALKVLELKAKVEGFYTSKKNKTLSIKDLTDSEIELLMQDLTIEENI